MPLNKGYVLASRPEGEAREDNFRWFEKEIGEPAPGEVLVRNLFLSLDPYMRGRMDGSLSYAAPQALDAVMLGGTVGEVVASNNGAFSKGDKVVSGNGGWQLYNLSDGTLLRKVDDSKVPLQAFVGALGMPGVTAFMGLNKILFPKPGQTVLVSAATGAVGAVAGQLAKASGARVVGIAGGAEKCAYAVKELGYDACVDHKAADFSEQLNRATPDGVDGLFENVGGRPFALTLQRMNDFGRIAICGLVATYEGAEKSRIDDMRIVLTRRLTIRGFIVSEFLSDWPAALAELIGLASSGKLKWRESIAEGLENAPAAFLGMLKGRNFGKQLVRLT